MARRRKRAVVTEHLAVPVDRLEAAIGQYIEWIETHHFSLDTVATRRVYLGYFHARCRERGLESPTEITRPILERYQRWLYRYRKSNGQPLGVRTQHTRLQASKASFSGWRGKITCCIIRRRKSCCRAWGSACPSTCSTPKKPSR